MGENQPQSGTWGTIPNFNHTSDDWEIFKTQLEQFFILNDIEEAAAAKRRAILINALHKATIQLLINLLSPEKPEVVAYNRLIETLDNHFKPVRSEFAERKKFYESTKTDEETIPEWEARVRSLAANCKFNTHLGMVIRDKFIMGMEKGPVKDKLFLEDVDKLTMAEAVKIANAIDCIQHQYQSKPAQTEVKLEPAGVYKLQSKKRGKPSTESSFKKNCGIPQGQKCSICGYSNHNEQQCRYKNYRCKRCKSKGHLQKMCKAHQPKPHHYVDSNTNNFSLFYSRNPHSDAIAVNVSVNGVSLRMEVDSGAPVSAISLATYKKYFKSSKISRTGSTFTSYNGNLMTPVGVCKLEVSYNNISQILEIYVINNGGPPILGRDWMRMFNIELRQVKFMQGREVLPILNKFAHLFSEKLGTFNKHTVSLKLIDNFKPKFCKPRQLPITLKQKVEEAIDKLVGLGVLVPVDYSEWGTPIVPVLKKSGEVRICGDYKITVNPQLKVEQYPLPKIEELFAQLHGGKQFSKIDLSMAYQQLVLDSKSQEVTTISTTKGLFKYTRLVYGLASAPAIFQRVMDALFSGMEGVVCFMDDILVTAENQELHLKRLNAVLEKLNKHGLRVSKDKCSFLSDSINYLGYIVDKNGLHPCPKKVEAIMKAPAPTNVSEVQSFLGLINYYRKFIPFMADTCAPLYTLLKKNTKFVWGKEAQEAFENVKEKMASSSVLAHFDPNVKVKLTVDASPKGVAAVLSHVYQNGKERPISYASRKLNQAEQNYAQISREALAIVFGVKKYHHYLFGRRFILVSDNKPLVSIFGPKKGIPEMAANRLQRYALMLSGYQFDTEYVNTKLNVADYLSRCPLDGDSSEGEIENVFINYVSESGRLPLTFEEIKSATAEDQLLTEIMGYVKSGWPDKTSNAELKPFFARQNEISIESGCIFWGYRIIVPLKLREAVLRQLHSTHFGTTKMKQMARDVVWWPKMDAAIEQITNSCEPCLRVRATPAKSELVSWKWPTIPWVRIHVDYLGPFFGKMFMVVVDAHSKWVECIDMNKSITAQNTIAALHQIFARFGLPCELVTDNGTSFISKEFQDFLQGNGIQHLRSPVGHPPTNGQAENGVKLVKNFMKKKVQENCPVSDLNKQLAIFLLDYRNTIHCTTGEAPATLMMNRKLRTRLSLLNPLTNNAVASRTKEHVERQLSRQKKYYGGNRNRSFKPDDNVLVKDYRIAGKQSWVKARVIQQLGRRMFLVSVPGYKLAWKRHVNQMLSCNSVLDDANYTPDVLNDPTTRVKVPPKECREVLVDTDSTKTVKSPRYNLRKRCNKACTAVS